MKENESLTSTDQATKFLWEQAKLKRLVDLGVALANEKKLSPLIEAILNGAMEISGADGGFFLMRTPEDTLSFSIVRALSLDIHMGGESGIPIGFPGVKLWDAVTKHPNHHHVAAHVIHQKQAENIKDIHSHKGFDTLSFLRFDRLTGYYSRSLLVVPLIPRGKEPVGVLQLLNAHDPLTGEVISFSLEIQNFVEALAAQAAVALENHNLMADQRKLMDSFTELIAQAIDSKSPYTGGHCSRVPELARFIAEAASNQKEGPFAKFSFTSEEEWREFKIAGLLHDCGKVTTPDYVVDKATKLETIYNRIHEIRTRFEVLWRDAEIAYWQKRATGNTPVEELDRTLQEEQQRLVNDFAFVAECNIGGESMSESHLIRLREVASRTWLRHFDNRLGISQEEIKRNMACEPQPLPAVESLLADRPDHIVPRAVPNPFGEKNPHGFQVEIPDVLYNLGEIYNLSISRGTLTLEERFKIIDHAIETILMLNHLPFPKDLAKVPEYAGAHHETLNGKGYPRRLTERQISIPARILAIADIFEALTASDRPYKKPKKLSEALRIMAFMVKDRHIDRNLFELFLVSKTYQRYAEQYMNTEQIDEVDIVTLCDLAASKAKK